MYFCNSKISISLFLLFVFLYILKLYFSWYRNESMDLKKTHGIEIDSWYIIRLMVQTWTHGLDIDSWYRHGLMVLAKTHGKGIENTHGIDLNSWYSIGTSESHTYERAECYPYAGFLKHFWLYASVVSHLQPLSKSQPSECGRQRTLNTVHGHTAAWLQSN